MGKPDPDSRPERPSMQAALDALKARKGAPTEADAPPPSTLPMTPAARAAKAMSTGKLRK